MRTAHHIIAIILASPLIGERLPIRPYTTAEGLANNHVKHIRKDSRGFLWLCTDEGLSRFDGQSFTNYTTRDGLPHPWVNDLLETRNGDYWVATDRGVCRYYPAGKQRFRAYLPSARPGADRINALLEDGDGNIWCGTYDGLYRMVRTGEENIRFVKEEIGTPADSWQGSLINAVFLDRRNTLWVGGRSGLYRREKGGSWKRYFSGHTPAGNFFEAILEDRSGRLWGATRTKGLCSLIPEAKAGEEAVSRCYSTADGLPSNDVRCVYQSSDKRLWVGAIGGLSELQLDTGTVHFRNYTTANGLSESAIYSLQEDRDGNLWIGTKESGVMRMAQGGLSTYADAKSDQSGGFGSSIFESQTGELCVTAGDQSSVYVNAFDGSRFSAIRLNAPRGRDAVWESLILQGRGGEWWVTTGEGLFRFPAAQRARNLSRLHIEAAFTVGRGLLGNDVHPLYQDSRGDLWFASSREGMHELYRWERRTDTVRSVSASAASSLKQKLITAIAEDRSGELWMGFREGGLVRGGSSGFAEVAQPTGSVQALHFDTADRLWIGSLETGLIAVDKPASDHPRSRKYTTASGLSSNHIWCITEDRFGRIYLGTSSGIDRLDPATGLIRHYTTSEGLAKGAVKAAYRDHSGALWFATNSGISRLIPALDQNSPRPVILISALRVMGASYPISELGETRIAGLTLPASRNEVEVEFFALDFSATSRPRYQYKLDSVDQDWTAPSEQHKVYFANLGPGRYRFLERAVNPDGMSSPRLAILEFTVMKPLWARPWFLTMAALATGIVVFSAYRYRVGQLIRVQLVRARIAADLHDDIGASLSQIAILSEVARTRMDEVRPDAAGPIAEITTISREAMDSISDMVWVINPRYDHLSDLAARVRRFAEDVLGPREIVLQFQGPDAHNDPLLGAEVRRHILLIAKEAVHNIAKHSGATKAHIEFELHSRRLTLRLSDNGRGFDCAQTQQGNGLVNICRRTEWLGGSAELHSFPGKGVAITVSVSL